MSKTSSPRITVEKCNSVIQKMNQFIDNLENHCTISDDDSVEIVVFKLYAKLQDIEKVFYELKKYRQTDFKVSKDLSQLIQKSTIPDKELEAFVKKLQKDGAKFFKQLT